MNIEHRSLKWDFRRNLLAVGSWQLAVGKIKLTRHNKTSKLEKKTKEKNYRNISGR
jgi:hypothetical protein